MCDGAKYIRSAAKKVFPSASIELCNFHFWQTQENKLKNKTLVPNLQKEEDIQPRFQQNFQSIISSKRSTSIAKVLKFDIRILQSVSNEKMFLNYVQIMKPFWKTYTPKYWTYFFENYIDVTKSDCYTGWQNFMRKTGPRTNNSNEAFNRVMKEVMTDYRKLPFEDFTQSVLDELRRRSQESCALLQFPTSPLISETLLTLSQCLANSFDSYFIEYEGNYFVKDKFIVCSIYNPDTGKVKQKIKKLASKIKNENEEARESFLEFYKKPSIRSIQSFKEANHKIRAHFLTIASIRQLQLNIVEDNNDLTLLSSSCSCNDYWNHKVCIHLIALLIKEGHFDAQIRFKKQKKRGRKPNV